MICYLEASDLQVLMLQLGFRMGHIVEMVLHRLISYIHDVVTDVVSGHNYHAAVLIGVSVMFDIHWCLTWYILIANHTHPSKVDL